ncbi:MAG TPA: hypothetical protein DEH78_04210 [Solibacterales bacterium]|nr:hypothetical protein [Bryobacterales bacterium]
MNFDLLRTLTTVAETGSLAAAAQRLHLTPAAIHKQLKLLEVEFGVPLYEKVGRGIRMSASTALLLPYAESAMAQIAAAHQAIEEWRGVRRGLVRIGSGPTLGSHWLPRLLGKFRGLHPSVVVTVDSGSSEELLTNARLGRIDLALLLAPPGRKESGFEVLATWRARLVFVTADASLAPDGSLRSLSARPFLGYRKGSRMDAMVEGHFSRMGIEPDTVMRFDNADGIRAMLRTGFGFSLLPAWMVTEDLAGRLRILGPAGRMPTALVELVRFAESPLSPAARELVRLARAEPLEASV